MSIEDSGSDSGSGSYPAVVDPKLGLRWKLDAASLVEKYRPFLKTIAAAEFPDALNPRIDDSDLVQDVLIRACRDVKRFRGTTEAELRGWLREILKNRITDLIRYNQRQQRDIRKEQGLPDPGLHASNETPSEVFRKEESSDLLWQAVNELPEPYRMVLLLHHQYNHDFVEISERMQRTTDAVRMLWGRAIIALGAKLNRNR